MDEALKTEDIFLLFGSMLMLAKGSDNIDFEFEVLDSDVNAAADDTQNDYQQNTLSVKSIVKDKAIEIYAKKIFANVRKTLKSREPFDLGSTTRETINEKDFSLTFQLKNVKIFNLSSFKMKKFKSTSEKSSVEFSMTLPSVKLMANYDIDGKFLGKTVKGSGDSEIDISGMTVDNGKITVLETPLEIQITSLSFCYSFKTISIKQSGLTIEDVKPEEVTKFLNDTIDKYFKQNKNKICEQISTELKIRANQKLKGKTRDELQNLMK